MTGGTTVPVPGSYMEFSDVPYSGIFGDTVIARVVEEIIADPNSVYRPKDLEELTENSPPSIREALATLTKFGLLKSSGGKHPAYVVDKSKKTFVALTLLAYAALDDKGDSDCMNTAIYHYYETMLRSRYEPYATATTLTFRYAGTGHSCLSSTAITGKLTDQNEAKTCIGGSSVW
ncbi:MAG: hypothetical protein Q8N94_00975 [Methanoregula sp.]|nr:hypothetical protein [Methanoregula sp.]